MDKNHIIIEKLEEMYKGAYCMLEFSNPFEMLISTILSAQTTDRQVNNITKVLFKKFPDPNSFAVMEPRDIEPYIKSVGVYKNKAKSIVNACRKLIDDFDSKVPSTMEELITLPGVGRKTANVVLSNAFGKNAIAVDTHVFRVANRLGLANAKNVLETEKQLMLNIDEDKWSKAHHYIIWHGRQICNARKPKCEECSLVPWCDYFMVINKEL